MQRHVRLDHVIMALRGVWYVPRACTAQDTGEARRERVHFASMIHPGCTPRPAGLHTHAHGRQGITRDAVAIAIANASQTVRCMPIYLSIHPSTPAVGAYYAWHVVKRQVNRRLSPKRSYFIYVRELWYRSRGLLVASSLLFFGVM